MERPSYMCAESMKLIVVRPLLIDCLHALEEAVTLLDIPFATDLSVEACGARVPELSSSAMTRSTPLLSSIRQIG
jgi:hypothetical protein